MAIKIIKVKQVVKLALRKAFYARETGNYQLLNDAKRVVHVYYPQRHNDKLKIFINN